MSYNSTTPILLSDRLLFRQHEMADLDAFCAMEMDPEIRRYAGGQPRTREESEQRFKDSLKPVTDRLSMWATVLKDTGTYIGRCGVYPHFDHDGQPIQGEGTLAFYIARMYWNNGYATEAGQAFIRFAFDDLKLNLLTATVQTGNDASVHILKKLGFDLIRTEVGARSFHHFELKNPVT